MIKTLGLLILDRTYIYIYITICALVICPIISLETMVMSKQFLEIEVML
jgi:hypothetical protein